MSAAKENNNSPNLGRYHPGMAALVKGLHFIFIVLTAAIIGMFIWLFTFGGYFIVQPQEAVLHIRFGELLPGVYTDDWHWVFPYPVDRIVRVPTNKQRLSTSYFWPSKSEKDFMKKPDELDVGRDFIPGKDGYLLTGDANIILTKWEMVYQITEPATYYRRCLCPLDPREGDNELIDANTKEVIGVRGPRTLLRNLLESTILNITSSERIDDALYKKSMKYARGVESAMAKKLRDLDIGVTVDSVILKIKSPPGPTVRAFKEVLDAEQASFGEQDLARKDKVTIENETQSKKSQILADAEVYRQRSVSEVRSEVDTFEKILEQCRKGSSIVLTALFNEVMAEVLSGSGDKFIIHDSNGRREVRLKINPEPAKSKNNQESGEEGR